MFSELEILGREANLFADDLEDFEEVLVDRVSNARFLVLGGAGSIGQATVKQIFKRNPSRLHVVDISENNLVELVRDLRSSIGYINGEFKTFALDIGSVEFDSFIRHSEGYDYVLNLSALKHVRSEEDPYTLMRMLDVNILNTLKTIEHSRNWGSTKYFCVSTDKAANPVNMMGASKRIMELFLMRESSDVDISTARFANVAFSDGSLLYGFAQRFTKRQPIVAPSDIKRYFITPAESGVLCLLSCVLGENRDIFFPKLTDLLSPLSFEDIALRFLESKGLEPVLCSSEEEARSFAKEDAGSRKYPCLFLPSDTTGEKNIEEFYTASESIDMKRFKTLGIVKHSVEVNERLLEEFEKEVRRMRDKAVWSKEDIVSQFRALLPNFDYDDVGKYLDAKM